MSIEKSFLQSICESPADDGPRLIYADWLDDHGQPERAEFIRTQIRLASIDEWDPARPDLLRREQALLRKYVKKWSKEVAKFTKRIEFVRGFIGTMALPVGTFLNNAKEIFATVPLLEYRPVKPLPGWDNLIASKHLARLRGLDLHANSLGVGRTQALAQSKHLRNLETLNLGVASCRGNGVKAVLASRNLGNLRRLDLNQNGANADSLADLPKAKHLPHLRHLNLHANDLDLSAADPLARAEWLAQLETLILSGNKLENAGVKRLAEAGVWAGLRTLDLGNQGMTIDGIRCVTRCRHLARLGSMRIDTVISPIPGMLGEVVRSPHLSQLRKLELHGGPIDEAETCVLTGSPLAANLRSLFLRELTAPAVRALLKAKSLGGLRSLNLSCLRTKESAGLAEMLRDAEHLSNLDQLDLSYCPLGDRGLAVLANCPHFATLGELAIAGNADSAAGYDALIDSPYLKRLRRLRIDNAYRFTIKAVQRMKDAFGADVVDAR